jgi:hypothetical protein
MHQKVLATEDVMQDCLRGLVKCGRITHPCDFLYLSDNDIWLLAKDTEVPYPEEAPSKSFSDIAGKLQSRLLPKRCLVLDRHNFETSTVELDDQINGLLEQIESTSKESAALLLKKFGEDYGKMLSSASAPGAIKKLVSAFDYRTAEEYDNLRKEWLELIVKHYEEADLQPPEMDFLDLNIVMPHLKDSHLSLYVVSKTGEKYQKDTFDYINSWSDSFSTDKWKGYFFVAENIDKAIAAEAAKELIRIKRSYIDQDGLIKPLLWS